MASYQVRAAATNHILFTLLDTEFEKALSMAKDAGYKLDAGVALYGEPFDQFGVFPHELWVSDNPC